jgi:hypothetical protein
MVPDVLETLEESFSPTPFNIRHHDAHYLYLKKEFAQWRAHYITPTKDACHCVVPGHVIRHPAGKDEQEQALIQM